AEGRRLPEPVRLAGGKRRSRSTCGSKTVASRDAAGDAAGDRRGEGGGGVMKIKDVVYKDDGKVETRMRFGDNLVMVVSAPVRVAIEGDTTGLDKEEVDKLCRELERGIARELDFRLFELCVEIIRVAGGVEMMAAQAVAKEQFTFR